MNLDREIRALNWKEPFASLMLHGKIETRVWPTAYRGPVLICTSLKSYDNQELFNIAGEKQLVRIKQITDGIPSFKLGYAIAIGELVDCRPMTLEDEDACFVQYREPWVEYRKRTGKPLKEVTMRLWCHIYQNVRPITPFAWKGAQRWKNVNPEHKSGIILL